MSSLVAETAEQGVSALSSVRQTIARLPENGIVEVAKAGWEKPGLIPLWFGESDMASPAAADEAAIASLQAGETRYAPTRGLPPVRQAIADYETRLHGKPIGPDRITLTAGGMQAIMLAMQALIDPGDEVLIVHPLWPNAAAAVEIMGGVVRPFPLVFGQEGWQLDMQALMDACGPRTRAIYVNSPNNPTGWVMSRAEIQTLLDFARRRGLWILSDEVYGRITYGDGIAPSFLDLAEPEDRVMVFNTYSKNWAMTGWRLGWLTAPDSLGQVFESLTQFSTTGVPTFLHAGAQAATKEGEPQVAKMIDMCRAGEAIVSRTLTALPNVGYAPPAGAFYAFFSVQGEPDSRALALRLIEDANVGLAPGSAFGPGGEGYLRLCFARSADRLAEAMGRLERALDPR